MKCQALLTVPCTDSGVNANAEGREVHRAYLLVFYSLDESGAQLGQTLGVAALQIGSLTECLNQLLRELAALFDEHPELVESVVTPLVLAGVDPVQGQRGPAERGLGGHDVARCGDEQK